MQRLILPINDCVLTAGWKAAAYRRRYGCIHYGCDLIARNGAIDGDRTVYASGTGTVLACGRDSVVGNVAAVLYPDALDRATGRVCGVVLRYFHLHSIAVSPGQRVTKDTVLGVYGNTGKLNMGKHLHLEADTDTRFPLHSPTVTRSDFIMGMAQGANGRTVTNPLDWLHCKAGPPDNQRFRANTGASIPILH